MRSSVPPIFRTWHIVNGSPHTRNENQEISKSEVGIEQTYDETREMCFSRSQDGKDTLYWFCTHTVFSTPLP